MWPEWDRLGRLGDGTGMARQGQTVYEAQLHLKELGFFLKRAVESGCMASVFGWLYLYKEEKNVVQLVG